MSIAIVRNNLKRAFGISILLGFLCIYLFFQGDQVKYGFWICVIIMFGYILYGTQQSRKYLYLPDFADSVYYLGFIFTLLSLLGATYFEQMSGDPKKTLAYFGMALASTLIGLIYRAYHMQFTDIDSDPVEKAKEELEQEVADFRKNIEDLRERIDIVGEKLLIDFPDKLSESIDVMSSNFTKIDAQLNSNLIKLTEKTAEAASKTEASYDNLTNKLTSSATTLANASQSIVLEITKVNDNIKSYYDKIDGGDLKELLDTTSENLKESTTSLRNLSTQIRQTSKSYKSSADVMNESAALLRKEIDQVQLMFTEMGELLKTKIK